MRPIRGRILVLVWGVKSKHISWFIFSPYFYCGKGGMVGKRAVKSGLILSSLRPVYPPYKSGLKKNSQNTGTDAP